MSQKKVLCIDWGANGLQQAAEALGRLGCEPTVATVPWQDVMSNPDFCGVLKQLIDQETPSFVFTHNFFPQISDVCEEKGLPYLSLVFDSPHMPLRSVSAEHAMNHIWLFDRGLMTHLQELGATRLHHTLLPADPAMARRAGQWRSNRYEHDVTFLGRLYQHNYVYYDEIRYLPEDLRGCLDGVIAAQQHLFGYDLIGDPKVLPEDKITEMRRYVNFEVGESYRFDPDLTLRDMLRKKVSAVERTRILAQLGKHFSVDLYTAPDDRAPDVVRNLGVADYVEQMPRIFQCSRINLNISLRTIRTGIPLRAMDILACGGFLLSTSQAELTEYFRVGSEVEVASTMEEMIDKTAWYLSHEEERERIAATGQKAALERFSTDIVFRRMMEEMNR